MQPETGLASPTCSASARTARFSTSGSWSQASPGFCGQELWLPFSHRWKWPTSAAARVAIDQSRSALAQARARAKREGLRNVTFLRQDLHHLSLASEGLDLVVLSQSLHHVEDPPAVLGEAARILKPGGKVVVLELTPHSEVWVKERLGHRHLGFEPAALERLLRSVGFGSLTREVHPREASSAFRVFLLTGEKQ
jgi:SAM-dependent methyltransferase